jgi:hypothetical protein
MQWTVNPSPIGLREFESHPAHQKTSGVTGSFYFCGLFTDLVLNPLSENPQVKSLGSNHFFFLCGSSLAFLF